MSGSDGCGWWGILGGQLGQILGIRWVGMVCILGDRLDCNDRRGGMVLSVCCEVQYYQGRTPPA